jgi:hypothetical protein
MASPLCIPLDVDADAVHEFVIATIRSELGELQRYGLVTHAVFYRCLRYLDKHPGEFYPLATGPMSSADLVDLLLQVAS